MTAEELNAIRARVSYDDVSIHDVIPLLAEVEMLRAEVEMLRAEVEMLRAEVEMLRAEVEMLRGVGCGEDGDGPCGVCRKCAYQRGAEAEKLVEWTVTEEDPCVVTTKAHGHFLEVAPTVTQGLWAWRIEPFDKRVRAKGTAPTLDEAKDTAISAARGMP